MDHEGYSVASWLSSHGGGGVCPEVPARTREGSTYTVEGTELQDAQRAMRLIRSRAAEWHVDPAKLGVIGFFRRRRTCRPGECAAQCRERLMLRT